MQTFYPRCVAVLQVLFQWGEEDKPEVMVLTPVEATVQMNDYRNADTWSLSFSSGTFPVDPEIVRSIGVEIYMFDAGDLVTDLEPFLVPENLQIAGLNDVHGLEVDEEGTVHLEGQDYTALLNADGSWPHGKVVPVGRPIDVVMQEIVKQATGFDEHGTTLRVVFQPDELIPTPPLVGRGLAHTYRRGIPANDGDSWWDVIYRTCLRHGLITYVRGYDLVIAAPAALTDATVGQMRRMAFGKSIQRLSITRNVGHQAAPTVIATSYDPVHRVVVEAAWPTTGLTITKKKRAKHKKGDPPKAPKRHFSGTAKKPKAIFATGHTKDEIRRVEAPPGITDLEALRAFARAYSEQTTRGEAKLQFETKRLRDLDGKDMIALRTGNPVFVEFDPFNSVIMRALDEKQRYQRLVNMGFGRDIAGMVARNYDQLAGISRPFYCSEVRKHWLNQNDGGLQIDVTAVNYIDPEDRE